MIFKLWEHISYIIIIEGFNSWGWQEATRIFILRWVDKENKIWRWNYD